MPTKLEDIRELLRLNSNREKLVEVIDSQLANLRQILGEANLPEAFWQDLRTELARTDDLDADLERVYDRHLSHEAVLWAIRAHSDPMGKEFFRAMVDVGKDSMEAGTARGEEATRRVMAKHGLLPN